MCKYGFGRNTHFDKLRDYVEFLVYNDEPLTIDEIADELDVSNKTIIEYNKKLFSKEIALMTIKKATFVKDVNGRERQLTADEYADWRDNWNDISKRLLWDIEKGNFPHDSTIKFQIAPNGDFPDWFLPNEEGYYKRHRVGVNEKEINLFKDGKVNGFIIKYMRQWSIQSFGWKNMYNKFVYGIDKSMIDDDFYDLLIDDDLVNFLEDNLDVPLDKETKEQLINLVDVRVDGKRKKSINAINCGLKENNLPYYVTQKRVRNIRHWVIQKIDMPKTALSTLAI